MGYSGDTGKEMGTLTLHEIGNLLEATPALLRVQLGGLDNAILRWRPAAGEWCIKEVIGHLIETDHIAFMGRVRQMLDADYPTLGGMDVDGIAAARRDDERDLGELLDELTALRAEIGPFVAALSSEELARAGAGGYESWRVRERRHWFVGLRLV